MLASTTLLNGLCLRTVQVACGPAELLDDVLITVFPATTAEEGFVRVAVFDAAENKARPGSRHTAHRAVGVARQWFRTERDPIVAVNGAALHLHDPSVPADANPLTTAVWADVRASDGGVEVLSTGRVGDGEVAITADGQTEQWLTGTMLTPAAHLFWADRLAQVRATAPAARRAARVWHNYVGHLPPQTWLNPPLGMAATPTPELREDRHTAKRVLVATDGLELDEAFVGGRQVLLDVQVAALTTRQAPPGMPYPHGDIAAIEVSAA